MPKRVFVPNRLIGDAERIFAEAGLEVVLRPAAELRGFGGRPELQQQRREAFEKGLGEHLAGAQALQAIGLGQQLPVTADLLDSAPQLEVVFVPSAGVDVIDVAAATERGVAVVNAAGNNYVSVAEHAVALMLSLTRQVARTDRLAHAEGARRRRSRWASPRASCGARPSASSASASSAARSPASAPPGSACRRWPTTPSPTRSRPSGWGSNSSTTSPT